MEQTEGSSLHRILRSRTFWIVSVVLLLISRAGDRITTIVGLERHGIEFEGNAFPRYIFESWGEFGIYYGMTMINLVAVAIVSCLPLVAWIILRRVKERKADPACSEVPLRPTFCRALMVFSYLPMYQFCLYSTIVAVQNYYRLGP